MALGLKEHQPKKKNIVNKETETPKARKNKR